LCVNLCVTRGFILALVLLGALNLANLGGVNAASSAPPGIKDGAYMWYKSVDFTHANKTDYIYVEFIEVHEHTAEIAIRTGLLSSNESEWSEHSPLYGHLDFESGDITLVGATSETVLSFWASPQNANKNVTSAFAPDNKGYASVECWMLESETRGERWWYDEVTGVLIETSILNGDQIVILYETNIPVGRGAANQWALPLQTPADTMTYTTILIGSVAAIVLAIVGFVRYRRKKGTPQGVLVKRCPTCGYKNKDDAVFCSNCGNSLAALGAPVTKPERLVSAVPVEKTESAVSVAAPSKELEGITAGPVETRNVCKTCGHVNPEWVRNYCVRCAAKLKTD
jgi:hypothetical protein